MSLTAELTCLRWWTHRVEFFLRLPLSGATMPGNPDNLLLEPTFPMSLTAELRCVRWWTHRVEFFFRLPPSRATTPGNPDNPLLELSLVCRIGKIRQSCVYNHRAFRRVATFHCKG